jgi:hypothetical protein
MIDYVKMAIAVVGTLDASKPEDQELAPPWITPCSAGGPRFHATSIRANFVKQRVERIRRDWSGGRHSCSQ